MKNENKKQLTIKLNCDNVKIKIELELLHFNFRTEL